jgi:hypothetical protein
MRRPIIALLLPGILLVTTACAQSIHQVERGSASRHMNAGYADGPYWGGSGYWWNPFGYYGSGYRWSGGHSSGSHHRGGSHRQASPPALPPTPPSSAPPQFKK